MAGAANLVDGMGNALAKDGAACIAGEVEVARLHRNRRRLGCGGERSYSAECPFVYYHCASGYYYLFRTQHYGESAETRVYRSKDPADFGVGDDRNLVATLPVAAPEIVESHGQLYIAALLPNLKGIQLAKLGWAKKP